MTEPDDINVVKDLLIGEQRENANLRAELKMARDTLSGIRERDEEADGLINSPVWLEEQLRRVCENRNEPYMDRAGQKEMAAENARLRAIVDKVPKTADGVPITFGRIWGIDADEKFVEGFEVTGIFDDGTVEVERGVYRRTVNPEAFYSTFEIGSTALAARGTK